MSHGDRFIIFKTDIYAGTVTVHCHILTHEDQGAMGTVLITSGCDGDYNDVGEPGSCHYVDTCQQFGTLEPTPSPVSTTADPTKEPSMMPTLDPTQDPISVATTMVMELTMRGRFSYFTADADTYANGDSTDLVTHVINWAHGLTDHSEVC